MKTLLKTLSVFVAAIALSACAGIASLLPADVKTFTAQDAANALALAQSNNDAQAVTCWTFIQKQLATGATLTGKPGAFYALEVSRTYKSSIVPLVTACEPILPLTVNFGL